MIGADPDRELLRGTNSINDQKNQQSLSFTHLACALAGSFLLGASLSLAFVFGISLYAKPFCSCPDESLYKSLELSAKLLENRTAQSPAPCAGPFAEPREADVASLVRVKRAQQCAPCPEFECEEPPPCPRVPATTPCPVIIEQQPCSKCKACPTSNPCPQSETPCPQPECEKRLACPKCAVCQQSEPCPKLKCGECVELQQCLETVRNFILKPKREESAGTQTLPAPASAVESATLNHSVNTNITMGSFYFFAFINTLEYVLFDKFMRHYIQFNIPTANMHLVLHRHDNREREFMTVKGLCEHYNISFSVAGEYTSDIKRKLVNDYLNSLPISSFLVYPDLDEFFEYPKPGLIGLATDLVGSGRSCIFGRFWDRITEDGELRQLSPQSSIFEQFPRKTHITLWKFRLWDFKIMLLYKAPHETEMSYKNSHTLSSAKNCSYDDDIMEGYHIHHFKFTRNFAETVRLKYDSYGLEEDYAHQEMYQKQLEMIEERDGKMFLRMTEDDFNWKPSKYTQVGLHG